MEWSDSDAMESNIEHFAYRIFIFGRDGKQQESNKILRESLRC
jgi:hypothetical protein